MPICHRLAMAQIFKVKRRILSVHYMKDFKLGWLKKVSSKYIYFILFAHTQNKYSE